MKLSRLGICSRSEGTFGLSRVKWVLSNWMLITCWIWTLAEFSWQVPFAVPWIGAAVTLVAKPTNAAPTSGTSAASESSLRRSRPVTTHLRLQKRQVDVKSPLTLSPILHVHATTRNIGDGPAPLR